MSAVVAALFFGVVGWWNAIPPSHDRHWRPEVAVMPRAFIDGDRVRFTGVRDFDYRSRNDYTVRYEEREVQLSHLKAIDIDSYLYHSGRINTNLPFDELRLRSLINPAAQAADGVGRFLGADQRPCRRVDEKPLAM
jgi:hypothetical protein